MSEKGRLANLATSSSHDQLVTAMNTFYDFFNLSLSAAASVMFGVPLTDLCNRESSTVPLIVRRIVKHIEDVGLDQEGIYRINGNTRIIDRLKMDFDKGENLTYDGAVSRLITTPFLCIIYCMSVEY